MSLRLLHLVNETNASCPDFKGQNYSASFHTHSAAKGNRKKIYHGHLDGKGPRKGEHAVVKVFRDAAGTEEMCDTEIEKHKLARRLAKRFNKFVPDERCRINFTLPLKSTVERIGVGCYLTRHKTRHMDKKEWVLIEDNLIKKGEYESFIRKTGERMKTDPTTLDAFLHFTFQESEGKYVLCGFQGVQCDEGYFLTTPCIHSVDGRFGSSTDKGAAAIRKVFKSHRCNNLCYNFIHPEPCEGEEEEEEVKGSDSDSLSTNDSGRKFEQDLIGHVEKGHLNGLVRDNGLHKIEETIKENDQLAETIMKKNSLKKKHKEDHRSNVKAFGSLKKQPSF
ncbi:alpha-protein kinase 1-like [Physella acuta]|uniref:alpha-protein kinase 1-like n=1 Tax=Physella acuta TaxID=109671 RepID=UPI0027DC53BE|nr:alpha-protein kinase 1-like [Physella acuta]